MKYANKWSENAETAQQMEKNSSISLAFSFLTVLMQALLQQCSSKSKRCIQIPGLERNTKSYPGSSRKEIAKIHLCVTDAGWLPSKQAKTIHTAVTKASHTHKHKQKQTDVNTHTCIRTNIPRERGGGKKMVLNDESEDDEK